MAAFRAGAAGIGLDRRAATCRSNIAGAAPAMPSESADMRRNWSRSRRTSSWPSAHRPWRPLQQATRTVPIVFVQVADPVGAGFVASLARPGGNATGFTTFEYGISAKWLELLKEIAPSVTRVAVLRDPDHRLRDRPVRRNPGRGAVVRGGVDARSTCATPARSSAPSLRSRAEPNGGLIVTAGVALTTLHRD